MVSVGAPSATGDDTVVAGHADSGARLRTAFLVSSTGDWVYRFAVPLLVLRITGSALSTAFAYAIEFVPYTVLGLYAGVLADRRDRRRTLITCDALSCALAVAITGVVALPRPPVAAVYVLALALACVRPFYFPAFQGMVVEVTPPNRLSNLNAFTQSVDSALTMLGPLVGAAIVAAAGAAPATAGDAASFALSALLVAGIARRPPRASRRGERRWTSVGSDFAVGLRALVSARAVLIGTALITVTNVAISVVEGNLFYLVVHAQSMSRIAVGVVFAVQGAGALAGATVAPRLLRRHPTGSLITVGLAVVTVAFTLPVALPTWPALLVACAVECAAMSLVVIAFVTARQRLVAPDVIGRVVSVGRAVGYAAVPVGAVIGGWVLSGTGGLRSLFAVAAAVQVAVLAATVASPLRRLDRDTAPPRE